jgi:serine-type D-Ala-D-Ala carboxypeptidase (penicillin-binding protein 5/6)
VQTRYQYVPYGRPKQSKPPYIVALPLLFLLVIALFQYFRAVPDVTLTSLVEPASRVGEGRQVALPAAGGAAIHVKGLGTLATSGSDEPRPIASMTKTMTVYVILKSRPLAPGERGPTVTITAADVSAYFRAIAEDQSATPVAAGQVYSQYDMLQLILIASANNFATILAVWDAGSLEAFVAKMNSEAAALGMRNTIYADASGFSDGSISTPEDQLILAMAAMEDPVFAEIVGQAEATVPNVGRISNTNPLLGQEGIIGIKTGFTEEAGGCLMFAARRQAGGQTYEIYGVVMGQPTRAQAFEASRRLVTAVAAGVQSASVMAAGTPVGTAKPAWGSAVDLVAAENVQVLLWPGMTVESALTFEPVQPPLASEEAVGTLTLRLGEQVRSVPVRPATSLPGPSLLWRLTRI